MATKAESHRIILALRDPAPQDVAAGSEFNVTLSVSCTAGCDLRGRALHIVSPDGTDASEGSLAGDAEDAVAVTLKAPPRVGEHVWTVSLPACEVGKVPHDEAALTIAVTAIPNATSLAVWDIPSPVTVDERFAVAVGAKSAAECTLEGSGIDICDSSGAIVAHSELGGAPWPGTSALYWTTLELTAPGKAGLAKWAARFSATDVDVAA